jgi:hypothetical protein
MRTLIQIILIGLLFLINGCDYFYSVRLTNNTSNTLKVRLHYVKIDEYWSGHSDTINVELINSYKSDTVELFLKPNGYLILGRNHGIMNYYNAESLFCDYLVISNDSSKYIANSQQGVFNILNNFKKGEELGESIIVGGEKVSK